VAWTRTLCQKNTERQFTPASARRTNSDIQDYCKSIIVDDPVVTTRLAGAGVRSGGKLVSRTVISSSPHSESFVLRVSHLLTYVDTALGQGARTRLMRYTGGHSTGQTGRGTSKNDPRIVTAGAAECPAGRPDSDATLRSSYFTSWSTAQDFRISPSGNSRQGTTLARGQRGQQARHRSTISIGQDIRCFLKPRTIAIRRRVSDGCSELEDENTLSGTNPHLRL